MLLFCDGMDKYSTIADCSVKGWSFDLTGAGSWTYLSAGGVNGGGALQCEQDDVDASLQIRPAGGTELRLRGFFWFKSSGNPGAEDGLLCIQDNSRGVGLALSIESSGEITVHKSANFLWSFTFDISSTSGVNLYDGSFHAIEFHFLETDSSSSRFELWVDGVKKVDYTGETRASPTASYGFDHIDAIQFRTPDTSGIIEDVIFWDDNAGDNFTGDFGGVTPVIDTLAVNAAGSSALFTPSVGSNFQNVDESPAHDGDTTYNLGDNSADKDLYGTAAIAITPTSILGVVVNNVVRTETGNAVVKNKIKSGVTEGNGANVTLSGVSYQTIQSMFGVDPNTAAAWSEANVNASEIGLEMI